jgi:hypothetical protein
MAKRKQRDLVTAAKIQRAVTGYRIPMLEIVALYRAMETAAKAGANDNDLKAIVAGWSRVEVAA